MRRIIAAFLILLAGCGDRPAAPSAAQNEQLDEAEAMLDEEAGKEKGSATEAADPSDSD